MATQSSDTSAIPPGLESAANLLEVHSNPSSRSIRKMLNRIGLTTDLWVTLLVNGLQLSVIPLVTTLWIWLSSQFSFHSLSPCSAHISTTCVWGSQERQCEKTYWSPCEQYSLLSPHLPVTSLYKFIKLIKHDFPFVNPYWLLLIIFMYLMCLKLAPSISYSITFPGIKMNLIDLQFPWSSFLPLFKIGVTFVFFQSSGTSPSCYDQ